MEQCGQAAAASQHHSSDIPDPQSGHGTSHPAVAVVGSSASPPHPEQFHQPVVTVVVAIDVSIPARLNDTPVIFGAAHCA
jgi:hypothetical protein